MDSKPELKVTALQRSQIDKMVEMAGELLFEAHAGRLWARAGIRELSHHLGRLYGETIRACKEHDGLLDEVTTTFMYGMALEPNFGREEELRDSGAEAQEEKTAGQLLYEGQPHGAASRPWTQLAESSRLAFEKEAEVRAKSYSGVIRITEEEAKAKPYVAADAKLCWKCKGTKDMGFTTRVPCDAC